jgi:hypothetical protein
MTKPYPEPVPDEECLDKGFAPHGVRVNVVVPNVVDTVCGPEVLQSIAGAMGV